MPQTSQRRRAQNCNSDLQPLALLSLELTTSVEQHAGFSDALPKISTVIAGGTSYACSGASAAKSIRSTFYVKSCWRAAHWRAVCFYPSYLRPTNSFIDVAERVRLRPTNSLIVARRVRPTDSFINVAGRVRPARRPNSLTALITHRRKRSQDLLLGAFLFARHDRWVRRNCMRHSSANWTVVLRSCCSSESAAVRSKSLSWQCAATVTHRSHTA
jgi:hypothetical protein